MMRFTILLICLLSVIHAAAIPKDTRVFAKSLVDLLNADRPANLSSYCLNRKLMAPAQELAEIYASGQSYDNNDGRNLTRPMFVNGFIGYQDAYGLQADVETPEEAKEGIKTLTSAFARFGQDLRFMGVGFKNGVVVTYFVGSDVEKCSYGYGRGKDQGDQGQDCDDQ
ncbi:hypothetical protein MIR68_009283 [Amoeboaphelidium protococcarum]|nr:hypothetical protein MIR68_009283 [Amoeboaphelidium protococcarum]